MTGPGLNVVIAHNSSRHLLTVYGVLSPVLSVLHGCAPWIAHQLREVGAIITILLLLWTARFRDSGSVLRVTQVVGDRLGFDPRGNLTPKPVLSPVIPQLPSPGFFSPTCPCQVCLFQALMIWPAFSLFFLQCCPARTPAVYPLPSFSLANCNSVFNYFNVFFSCFQFTL